MRRSSRIPFLSLILLVTCGDPGQASTIFTVDQASEPSVGGFYSVRFVWPPIGQEFTPTQPSLDVVELFTGTPEPIPESVSSSISGGEPSVVRFLGRVSR
jgi:hypothetical protein